MALMRVLLNGLIDFALPRRCAGCGTVVESDGFCSDCWGGLHLLGEGGCAGCGLPVEGVDMRCGQCLASPPKHDGAIAAIAYGEIARHVITRFKYGGRIGLAKVLADQLERYALPHGDALFVPVPLHRRRLWRRGFNQAALVARQLAKRASAEVQVDLLLRHKQTPPLAGLNPAQRQKAVAGAFSLVPALKPMVKGRRIVLVDDVYTTGATVNACAALLKRAGAAEVFVLSWAHALPEGYGAAVVDIAG